MFTFTKLTEKDKENLAKSIRKSILDKRANDKRSKFKVIDGKR